MRVQQALQVLYGGDDNIFDLAGQAFIDPEEEDSDADDGLAGTAPPTPGPTPRQTQRSTPRQTPTRAVYQPRAVPRQCPAANLTAVSRTLGGINSPPDQRGFICACCGIRETYEWGYRWDGHFLPTCLHYSRAERMRLKGGFLAARHFYRPPPELQWSVHRPRLRQFRFDDGCRSVIEDHNYNTTGYEVAGSDPTDDFDDPSLAEDGVLHLYPGAVGAFLVVAGGLC